MMGLRLSHMGTPIPQGRSRGGRWGHYYPKGSTDHRESLAAAFAEQAANYDLPLPINEPIYVHIHLAGPRKNSDLDNHAKQILDALQDAGVIAEDDVRVVCELRVTRQLDIPKSQRHTAVEILPWVP